MKILPVSYNNSKRKNTVVGTNSFGMKVVLEPKGNEQLLKIINNFREPCLEREGAQKKLAVYQRFLSAIEQANANIDTQVLKAMFKKPRLKGENPKDLFENYDNEELKLTFDAAYSHLRYLEVEDIYLKLKGKQDKHLFGEAKFMHHLGLDSDEIGIGNQIENSILDVIDNLLERKLSREQKCLAKVAEKQAVIEEKKNSFMEQAKVMMKQKELPECNVPDDTVYKNQKVIDEFKSWGMSDADIQELITMLKKNQPEITDEQLFNIAQDWK